MIVNMVFPLDGGYHQDYGFESADAMGRSLSDWATASAGKFFFLSDVLLAKKWIVCRLVEQPAAHKGACMVFIVHESDKNKCFPLGDRVEVDEHYASIPSIGWISSNGVSVVSQEIARKINAACGGKFGEIVIMSFSRPGPQWFQEALKAAVKATSAAALLDAIRAQFDVPEGGPFARPEYRLALSRLCEAWMLTGGTSSKTASGITVHAPMQPADWFKPFGKSPGITAAAEIAKLMGDVESEAFALLEAVFNQTEIRALIEAFLVKVLIVPEFQKVRHSMVRTLPDVLPARDDLGVARKAVQVMLAASSEGAFSDMRVQLLELEKHIMALTLHDALAHCRQLKDAVNGDLLKIRAERF